MGRDKEKHQKAQREYYLRNKDVINKKARTHRDSKKRFVNAAKSFPCHDCDTSWPPCAMHFDHTDSTNKVADVSKLITTASWKRLVEEIMKCDLVCACCHAMRTNDRLMT